MTTWFAAMSGVVQQAAADSLWELNSELNYAELAYHGAAVAAAAAAAAAAASNSSSGPAGDNGTGCAPGQPPLSRPCYLRNAHHKRARTVACVQGLEILDHVTNIFTVLIDLSIFLISAVFYLLA